MTLREQVKGLSGSRRKFLLLRVADLDTKAALKLCGTVRGTYNNWLRNDEFVELYKRREEFAGDFKQEAIQLLRRDNQLEAVLLEGRILKRMKKELEANVIGEYSIIRSNLAKEVYSKLIGDLDKAPPTTVLTWQQRIEKLNQVNQLNLAGVPAQVMEGRVIDGEASELEAANLETAEHQTG